MGEKRKSKFHFLPKNAPPLPEISETKINETQISPEICEAETQTIIEEWVKEVPFANEEALPNPDPDLVWAMIANDLNEFMCELVSEVEIPHFLDDWWNPLKLHY